MTAKEKTMHLIIDREKIRTLIEKGENWQSADFLSSFGATRRFIDAGGDPVLVSVNAAGNLKVAAGIGSYRTVVVMDLGSFEAAYCAASAMIKWFDAGEYAARGKQLRDDEELMQRLVAAVAQTSGVESTMGGMYCPLCKTKQMSSYNELHKKDCLVKICQDRLKRRKI